MVALSRPSPKVRLAMWAASLLLAAFGLVGYWRVQVSGVYFMDEGIHTYVGWAWAQGDWPYRDTWDQKGPVVYLVTMLRSSVGGTGLDALTAQEIMLGALTAFLVAWIAFRLWGEPGGAVAFPLGILLWAQQPSSGLLTTPETLVSLLNASAILLSVEAVRCQRLAGSAALAAAMGLTGGAAFCTKPNAVAGLLVGGLLLLIGASQYPRRIRRLLFLWLAAGFALPVAAMAVLFYAHGVLPALIDTYFSYNSIRGRLMLQQWGIVGMTIMAARRLAGLHLAPLVFAVLAGAGAVFLRQKRGKATDGLVLRNEDWIIPCWLTLELGLLVTNGPYHWHHAYPAMAAIALGGTWLIVAPWRNALASGGLVSAALASLVLFPPAVALAAIQPGPGKPPASTATTRMAAMVESSTRPGEPIYVLGWNGPLLLSLAHRPSASRYVYPLPLYTLGYASDARWLELLDELRGTRPQAVLLSAEGIEAPRPDSWTLEQVLGAIDHPLLLHVTADPKPYPGQRQLQRYLANQYRLDVCEREWCLLRPRGERSQ